MGIFDALKPLGIPAAKKAADRFLDYKTAAEDWLEDAKTVGSYVAEKMPEQKPMFPQLDPNNPEDVYKAAKLGGQSPEEINQLTNQAEYAAMNFAPAAMTAFHGTPHKIVGGFKKSAIGSGEGAQAFGHGFYATDSRSIAKGYAKKLGDRVTKIKVGDKVIETTNKSSLYDVIQTAINENSGAALIQAEDFLIDAKVGLEQALNDNRYPTKDIKRIEFHRGEINKLSEFIEQIKKFEPELLPQGAVYTLDIPEEGIMLDWDKPLASQGGKIDSIADMVEQFSDVIPSDSKLYINKSGKWEISNNGVKMGIGNTPKDARYNAISKSITGEDLYNKLSKKLGDPQKASDYLSTKGIKGINYPAGTLSGAESSARNFVIFEPEDIKILAEDFLDQ
jgi:hypothetical protein